MFAYDNYETYEANKSEYLELNEKKLNKLKLLTIIDLVSKSKVISYDEMMKAINVSTIKELEELIIQCINLDLINGKMDQKSKVLKVDYSVGRDVKKEDRNKFVEQLKMLRENVSKISEKVNKSIQTALKKKEDYCDSQEQFAKDIENAKKAVKKPMKPGDNA